MLTKTKLKKFKEIFQQKQSNIMKNSFNRSQDTIDVGGDEIDIVQNNQIKSLSDKLSDRERHALRNLERCLNKINDGTFGLCEECEEPIGEARLQVMPEAILCISCAEELELNIKKGLNI